MIYQHSLRTLIDIAAKSDSNVVLLGPTGTGKSTLAWKIHTRSKRAEKPFVSINLATLHEGTLESELFGYERGAFTGAIAKRTGRLENANHGTVFLDEIGELPLRLQGRLLDFLQNRTISLLGGCKQHHLNVRIIAATNKDLEEQVRKNEFREDLFHRLRVIEIRLDSIQERGVDFDSIVHECLLEASLRTGKRIKRISAKVAEALESYAWPGNYRELINVLEYAAAVCRSARLDLEDLPKWFLDKVSGQGQEAMVCESPLLGHCELPLSGDYYDNLERFERVFLSRALARYRGRLNLTARKIGLNKTTLLRRIKLYQLQSQLSEPCSYRSESMS